jgi:hypothetical protein
VLLRSNILTNTFYFSIMLTGQATATITNSSLR